jgi:sulfur-carrier protein
MDTAPRSITVRFFAGIKDIFGEKEVALRADAAATVSDALDLLCDRPERRAALFLDGDRLRPELIVLINGRSIAFVGGLDAPLTEGDVLLIFPPLKGG